ncbi:hypothetical protein CRU86_03070 [Aliarcobacter skirrowii]|jgi:hypothetical protein|uniref:Membrane protein n=3 Tax=Aliarcobacter skirrowii TaxID=28200 RepID=A0AAD0SKJ2_9BACT|nr:hypothetical protein [Aliarcobacter skirrowii]AXX84324.1 putative membrane protein [Aliarcobacter skirrowii CCUG 10374]KAB0621499.1 hypothetical protein F7P70_01230 [Aliarcobacter skirrowii CCUG 10374]MDX4011399.1 hypothetical protein [Aliarcobacter skirrowii]MDX4027315.1 hypothetical protein [Aliarcobacter skirrowii]MDX4038969.1 hypothetical protein [Aliarcobacter skirrowii]
MTIFYLFIFFIAIELFETNWQKAPTLYGILENNFKVYQKNIFLYFILHPSFFYSIYLAITLNNFGFWMSFIVILKFVDISFKLSIMKKLSKNYELSSIIPFDANITMIFRYLNLFIYPSSFLLATSNF